MEPLESSSSAHQWLEIQNRSFLQWCNHHLEKRGLHVEDLTTGFCDGVLLCILLEIVSGSKIRHITNPRFPAQKLNNITEAFNFMERVWHIQVVGCNARDFVDGNKKSIMGVIFLLINKAKPVEEEPVPSLNIASDTPTSSTASDIISPRSRAKTWVKGPTGGYTQQDDPVASPHSEAAANHSDTANDAHNTATTTATVSSEAPAEGSATADAGASSTAAVSGAPSAEKPTRPPRPLKKGRDSITPQDAPKRPDRPDLRLSGESSSPSKKDVNAVADATEGLQQVTEDVLKPRKRDSLGHSGGRKKPSRGSKEVKEFTVDVGFTESPKVAVTVVDGVSENRRTLDLMAFKANDALLARLQAAFRAVFAKQKRDALRKRVQEVSQQFTSDPAALKKLARLQGVCRGRLVRTLPELRKKRRRNEIVREIVSTEDAYIRSLGVVVDVYHKNLKALGEDVISTATLRIIFSEVDVIRRYNGVIQQKLKERMSKWYSQFQRMGDIFLFMTDFLKVYTAYVNNYNVALKTLTDAQQNQKVAKVLMECRLMPETANMELTSYLIMPIQRIPRYVLLLSDLFKNTPEDHKDYEDLKKALAKMESVAEYVNTKKREAENLMGVLIVSKHISDMDNPAELAQPHRRYVRQGLLSEVDGKNIKNRYAFLFNDSLLCTKEEKSMLARLAKNAPTGNIDLETLRTSEAMFKYQYQVPLVGARLAELVDSKVPNAFEIVIPQESLQQAGVQHDGEMRLAFGAPTPAEKDAWLGDLDEMIMSALEKKRSRLEIAQEEERASETSGLGAVVTSAKRSVNHSGKLMKRAQSGEWKEKFFVLQDDVLRYWKSRVFMEQGEEPSNTIHLLFASVQLLPVMDRPVCFQVLTRDRIYNLSLPQSPAATVERLDWVTKIRDAIYIHIMEIEAKKPLKDVAAVASVAPRANVPILSAGATLADKPVTLTPPMAASSSSERSASPSDKRRDKERSKDKAATLKYDAATGSSGDEKKTPSKRKNRAATIDVSKGSSSSESEKRPEKERRGSAGAERTSKIGELMKIASSDSKSDKFKFVLTDTNISYYKPKRTKAAATIDLVVCQTVDEGSIVKKTVKEETLYCFKLQTADRVYNLGATSEADAQEWVSKLNYVIKKLRKK